MKNLRLSVAALTLPLFALTACGGGDDAEPASTTPTPSATTPTPAAVTPTPVAATPTPGPVTTRDETGRCETDAQDSDGDCVPDEVEVAGWDVKITTVFGDEETRRVTSDPSLVDSDDDGVDDGLEYNLRTDPNLADTDGDEVSDLAELNTFLTNPLDQDTDNDTLSDGTETQPGLATDPRKADTDGDGANDAREATLATRNPLIAEYPIPLVEIGTLTATLKTTYETSTGVTNGNEKTRSQSYSMTRDTGVASSRTDGSVNEIMRGASAGFALSATAKYGAEAGGEITATASAEYQQQQSRSEEMTLTSESSENISKSYDSQFNQSHYGETTAVETVSVDGGDLDLGIKIANVGVRAFHMADTNITVSYRDPNDRRKYRQVASLGVTNSPSGVSVAPGEKSGTLLAEPGSEVSADIAKKIRDMLRQPDGVRIELGNAEITTTVDEDSSPRNLANLLESIYSTTVGLTLDFGNGEVEYHRVAAYNGYVKGPDGSIKPRDIPLTEVLKRVGLTKITSDNQDTVPADSGYRLHTAIYKFAENDDPRGITAVTVMGELRGVRWETRDDTDTPDLDETAARWYMLTGGLGSSSGPIIPVDEPLFSNGNPSGNTVYRMNIEDIRMRGGDTIAFVYAQDLDRDGLFARDEERYRSSDEDADSDDDNLLDYIEVGVGWVVQGNGDEPDRTVYSNPVSPDSDGDGISDWLERLCSLDPYSSDTDRDGKTDYAELSGYSYPSFDGSTTVHVAPYIGAGSGNLREHKVLTSELVDEGEVECFLLADGAYATDPRVRDTDGDGLADGEEEIMGLNPNDGTDSQLLADSDNDGLKNYIESEGWRIQTIVRENGAFVSRSKLVEPNPDSGDTDNDGLPDLLEYYLRSDPTQSDTDGDGLSDAEELKWGSICLGTAVNGHCPASTFSASAQNAFLEACNGNADGTEPGLSGCSFDAGQFAGSGTHLNRVDSDRDGLSDEEELDGWTVNFTALSKRGVLHKASKMVFPDPLNANSDGQITPQSAVDETQYVITSVDQLSDKEEFDLKTDPRNGDTDGDKVSDSDERAHNQRYDLGRELTVADALVDFQIDNWDVGNDDCDPGSYGSGEFGVFLNVEIDDQATPLYNSVVAGSFFEEMDSGEDKDFREYFEDNPIIKRVTESFRFDGSLEEYETGVEIDGHDSATITTRKVELATIVASSGTVELKTSDTENSSEWDGSACFMDDTIKFNYRKLIK